MLSGTIVAPARLAPNATTGHAVPFGISTPTRVPLPTPRSAKWQASVCAAAFELAVRQRVVVGDDERALGLLLGPAPHERGDGQALTELRHRRPR